VAEYIDLWWDGDAPAEYVRGHVSEDEARQAMEVALGVGAGKDPWEIKHRWARWEMPGSRMRACGCERVMQVYDEKGSCMFKVTELRIPKPPTVGAAHEK
jgi:hypothetical protein